jgi:protein archease
MGRAKYKIFGHTADVGLYAYGENMRELFANAAEGLMSLLVDTKTIRPVRETSISLEAESSEALLRGWLAELLYLYSGEKMLPAGVEFLSLGERSLEAVVRGEILDQSRHEIKTEVKAVTWHGLKIERDKKKGRLKATLVLDV